MYVRDTNNNIVGTKSAPFWALVSDYTTFTPSATSLNGVIALTELVDEYTDCPTNHDYSNPSTNFYNLESPNYKVIVAQ